VSIPYLRRRLAPLGDSFVLTPELLTYPLLKCPLFTS
jgi:hypothetical protein